MFLLSLLHCSLVHCQYNPLGHLYFCSLSYGRKWGWKWNAGPLRSWPHANEKRKVLDKNNTSRFKDSSRDALQLELKSRETKEKELVKRVRRLEKRLDDATEQDKIVEKLRSQVYLTVDRIIYRKILGGEERQAFKRSESVSEETSNARRVPSSDS